MANIVKSPKQRIELAVESLVVIHVSCQTSGDNNNGISPRFTAIAVLRYSSETVTSFSIHLSAERLGIPRSKIPEEYDRIEIAMLEDFHKYVDKNPNTYWMHWNMRDVNYGFQAIEHRYMILTQKAPIQIPDEKKICLPSTLKEIYGDDFVNHPRMYRLMELNGGKDRRVLTGQEEVDYFNQQKYFEMHQSTIAKVTFFKKAASLLLKGRLKTDKSDFAFRVRELKGGPVVISLEVLLVGFGLFQIGQLVWSALK